MPIAIKALLDGMIKGMFTGRKLSDYFNATANDAEGARKIVNGTDKKALIAGYHKNFMDAVEASREILPPLDVTKADAKPDDKPASQSGTAITTVLVPAATGLAVPVVTGIDNVYALIFAVALLAVSCIAGFMFLPGRWSVNRSESI
jgi:putative chitinase